MQFLFYDQRLSVPNRGLLRLYLVVVSWACKKPALAAAPLPRSSLEITAVSPTRPSEISTWVSTTNPVAIICRPPLCVNPAPRRTTCRRFAMSRFGGDWLTSPRFSPSVRLPVRLSSTKPLVSVDQTRESPAALAQLPVSLLVILIISSTP